MIFKKFLLIVALAGTLVTLVPSGGARASEDDRYWSEDGTVAAGLFGAELLTEPEIYPIVFPVVGKTYFSDTFGACRDGCSRRHIGNDIMTYGVKGLPIVAAHDGVVETTSVGLGRGCCHIWGLVADDGYETWYIHMNNDTPGTDDGNGWGFAPGIEEGVRVEAGQLIGWVGDSGNAEWVAPQLHFEIRRPDGTPIDPYPSLLAATHVDLPRLAGATRFDTAAEIALDGYNAGVEKVFVTTGRAFPDALAAGAIAAAGEYPILLTEPAKLPRATKDALAALQPEAIVVLGGPVAVADGVAADLQAYGPVTRLGGTNRYETATLAASELFDDPGVVYLAYGYSYPEAVSAAVAAGNVAGPLILTDDNHFTGYARSYLASLSDVEVIIVGDTDAVTPNVEDAVGSLESVSSVTRIAAGTASETSIAVSEATFPSGTGLVYLATGGDYADALAGASLAGKNKAPVLLLSDDGLAAVDAEIVRLGADDVTVLGGPEAVGYEWILPMWNRSVGNTMPTWK